MAVAGEGRNKHGASRSACVTRRTFLGTAAATGTLVLAPGQARGYAANEQLQVAVIGCGGRGSGFVVEEGWSSIRQQTGGRIAALCDVNKKKAAESFQRHPDVPKYEDFRVMIDEMRGKLDAVVVATVAVGTALSGRPPHRSVREELPHTAPISGCDSKAFCRIGVHYSDRWNPPADQTSSKTFPGPTLTPSLAAAS